MTLASYSGEKYHRILESETDRLAVISVYLWLNPPIAGRPKAGHPRLQEIWHLCNTEMIHRNQLGTRGGNTVKENTVSVTWILTDSIWEGLDLFEKADRYCSMWSWYSKSCMIFTYGIHFLSWLPKYAFFKFRFISFHQRHFSYIYSSTFPLCCKTVWISPDQILDEIMACSSELTMDKHRTNQW